MPSSQAMKGFVVLLISFASFCTGSEWDAFKVTYGRPGSGLGYYDMPWTVQEAIGKWEKIDEDKKLNVDVYSQHGDPRVMLLFDKRGNIAGIRVAFLKDDVGEKAKAAGETFKFEYDNIPMYDKANYFGKDLWYASALFASPKTLASGGRRSFNKYHGSPAEAIYFRKDGKWTQMIRDECRKSQDFEEANCFPGMGKHYFYKLHQQKGCARRQPFFSIYDEGRLVGFGLAGFGTFTKDPNTQSYLEAFPENAEGNIISNGPECIGEYINKFGLTLLHVYFKKNAANISCPSKDWHSTHCT